MVHQTGRFFLIVAAMSIALLQSEQAAAQAGNNVGIKRKPLPVATITDRATIDFFTDQFMLPDAQIDSIDFVDVDGHGFNDRDVMIVYPKEHVYHLSSSDTAMAIMRQWIPTSVRVTGSKENDEIVVKSEFPAATAMYAGLVRLIEKNYIGKRISLMFEYDGNENIGTLTAWGYEENDLKKPRNPLEQFAHDLMVYVRTDTIYIEKPVYDIIYIEHSVTDSTTIYQKGGSE